MLVSVLRREPRVEWPSTRHRYSGKSSSSLAIASRTSTASSSLSSSATTRPSRSSTSKSGIAVTTSPKSVLRKRDADLPKRLPSENGAHRQPSQSSPDDHPDGSLISAGGLSIAWFRPGSDALAWNLSALTDLAFGPDGSLYALRHGSAIPGVPFPFAGAGRGLAGAAGRRRQSTL